MVHGQCLPKASNGRLLRSPLRDRREAGGGLSCRDLGACFLP